ncbi:MAG: DUF3263 domain-containing protein [Propionibacteriaceae bacterium]|jgi:hypothetical protein|nr:DUF3263 domain-containing protein [Propionibacteriaceae bacterium]
MEMREPEPGGLTDDEATMLAFERRVWRRPATKDQAIRERFGCSPARYYQRLNWLIDRPQAWAADPATVKRLRLRRDGRRPAELAPAA